MVTNICIIMTNNMINIINCFYLEVVPCESHWTVEGAWWSSISILTITSLFILFHLSSFNTNEDTSIQYCNSVLGFSVHLQPDFACNTIEDALSTIFLTFYSDTGLSMRSWSSWQTKKYMQYVPKLDIWMYSNRYDSQSLIWLMLKS